MGDPVDQARGGDSTENEKQEAAGQATVIVAHATDCLNERGCAIHGHASNAPIALPPVPGTGRSGPAFPAGCHCQIFRPEQLPVQKPPRFQ